MDTYLEPTELTIQQQLAQLQAQIVAGGTARENSNPEGKGFPDAPISDGG